MIYARKTPRSARQLIRVASDGGSSYASNCAASATIVKNNVVGEIVDEDPYRWSFSSAGREDKMKGSFLRDQPGSIRTKRPSRSVAGNFSW